jgi:glycosyltransferase involved in cell wall biosynthesis
MKVLIVSPFYNNDYRYSRPGFVRYFLETNKIDVDVVTSDFSHTHKKVINHERCVNLKTIKYKKNTSLLRFVSHFKLSLDFFFFIKREYSNYDVIYITAPFALTAFLTKTFINTKVIIDIVDFWPLSLPFPKNRIVNSILFFWTWLNKKAFKKADKVTSLSTTFLSDAGIDRKEQILLSGNSINVNFEKNDAVLNIIYIGNIGLLYDFNTLIKAMLLVGSEKFFLHIIGDGDKKDNLLKKLEQENIKYKYYGKVFGDDISSIIKHCDVGFNGYKNTTASFSYKAITYMQYGLPLINSMRGDLWEYIDNYKLGVNYNEMNIEHLACVLCEMIEYDKNTYHENVKKFFNENLEIDIIGNKFITLFNEAVNETDI